MSHTIELSKRDTILLILGGFAAGTINGLLGAGGGIITVFLFEYLLGREAARDSFAMTTAAVLSFSIVSVIMYCLRGHFDMQASAPYFLPAIAGGVAGACLLGKINTGLLRLIFAGLLIYCGIKYLFF